jgi:hypothetical protein
VIRPAFRLLSSVTALAALGALSACGGSTAVPPGAAPLQQTDGRMADPDKCNKKSTQVISPTGGVLTLPPCASYTGTISYGKSGAPSKTSVSLVTTTKNPGAPTPRGKTVLAYVIATGNSSAGSVTFGTAAQNSMIANTALLSSKTYALYAYALGVTVKGFPKQVGSPTDGVLTFKSPLNGETVPEGIPVDFELVQN